MFEKSPDLNRHDSAGSVVHAFSKTATNLPPTNSTCPRADRDERIPGPLRRRGRLQSPKPWVEGPESDELPVLNEPFIADTLGLEGVGDVLAQMSVSRVPQDQRTLKGAQHVALLGAAVGGESGASGKRDDGVGLLLRHHPILSHPILSYPTLPFQLAVKNLFVAPLATHQAKFRQ